MHADAHEAPAWPDTLDLQIDGWAQGGAGVGRWQQRPVFVQGAIPGEHVTARLGERRTGWARGAMTHLHGSATPERVTPPCPIFDQCGGCDWQYLHTAAQRTAKQQILHEQLTHVGRVPDLAVAPTLGRAAWDYRSTARLHVNGNTLGFYAPNSRRIVPLDRCPVLHPQLNDAIATLQSLLPVPGLREVMLRVSTTNGAIHAHLAGTSNSAWRDMARRWREILAPLSGVSMARGATWQMLAGTPYLHEQIGDVLLRIGPTSFFQANVEQARAVLAQLQQQLDLTPATHLLDGFCGVGTWALPLAQQVATVIGIEEHSAAIADAQASADAQHLSNVELHVGTVEAVLPALADAADMVILDPPRRGCAPAVLTTLIEQQPRQIAYVSCHPGTLARDVRVLHKAGYRVRWAQPFDFFPQTAHIESLVVLERDTEMLNAEC